MYKKNKFIIIGAIMLIVVGCYAQESKKRLTGYVNPFIGTTTLWDSIDLGYKPTRRAWGAEAYPGASVPNSMVQVTPVTMWRSGSGYQYEDTVIYALPIPARDIGIFVMFLSLLLAERLPLSLITRLTAMTRSRPVPGIIRSISKNMI
jgi:hypothetical protein